MLIVEGDHMDLNAEVAKRGGCPPKATRSERQGISAHGRAAGSQPPGVWARLQAPVAGPV